MDPEHKRISREAFAHAQRLERDLDRDFPNVWRLLDGVRADPPEPWPGWCLLPMAAATAVATRDRSMLARRPYAIGQISAVYAWRYSRSVYLVEPALMTRLLTQVPDAVELEDFTGLPEWCIYIPGAHPEFPGAGLWAHLEHDAATGRPELRLVIDDGDMPVTQPVYLDRGSTTEAIADYRATALTTAQSGKTNLDVRGGELDAIAAAYAERIDGYLGVLAYLARPEADIVSASRPGVRPIKPRKPKRDKDVWLVGYSNTPQGPS